MKNKLFKLFLGLLGSISIISVTGCDKSQRDIEAPNMGLHNCNVIFNDDTKTADIIESYSEEKIIEYPSYINGYKVTGFLSNRAAFPNGEKIYIPDSIEYLVDCQFDDIAVRSATFDCYNIYKGCYYLGSHTNPYLYLSRPTIITDEEIEIHPNTRIISNEFFMHLPNDIKISFPKNLFFINFAHSYSSPFITDISYFNDVTTINNCTYIGKEGNPYFVLYKAESGNTIEINPRTEIIFPYAFSESTFTQKSLIIPDSVTQICDYAFLNSNFDNIKLGKRVKTVGGYAFCGSNISTIVFNDDLISISPSAFSFCQNLKTLNLPKSLKFLGSEAFYDTNLESITLNENLIIADGLDSLPKTINTVDIDGDKYLPSYTNNRFCLFKVNPLASGKYVVNANTPCISSNAFIENENITSIDLNKVKILSMWSLNSLSIKDITIPESVRFLPSKMFEYCNFDNIWINSNTIFGLNIIVRSNIQNIVLGKHIRSFSFRNNYDLANYYGSLTLGENFSDYYSLINQSNFKEILVDPNNKFFTSVNGILYNKEKTILLKVPYYYEEETLFIPEGVVELGYLSIWCLYIKSIYIPSSLTTIYKIEEHNAYSIICQSLEGIYVDLYNSAFCDINGVLFTHNKKKLILYPINKQGAEYIVPRGTKEIPYQGINGTNLRIIHIPNTVSKIDNYGIIFVDDYDDKSLEFKIYCEAQSKPDGWSPEWHNYTYNETTIIWGQY